MDYKTLIASLTAEQRAALTEKSDRHGLARLFVHWGSIALLTILVALGVPGWQVLLLPLGILIVFLFTLLHEAVHRTPFSTEWINDVVARGQWLCSLLTRGLVSLFSFRAPSLHPRPRE